MVRSLIVGLGVLLALSTAPAQVPPAARGPDLAWQRDWKVACEDAAAAKKPVLVCVMKDSEIACRRMLEGVYTDAEVRLKLANYVLVPASIATHELIDVVKDGETVKSCPQFRGVLCSEHQALERALHDQLVNASEAEAIAPQHLVFGADGSLLVRREYEMKRQGFLEFLDRGLGLPVDAGAAVKPGPRSPAVEKLLEKILKAKDDDARKEATRDLLAESSPERDAAFLEAITRLKAPDDKRIVIRAAGYPEHAAWAAPVATLLSEKNPLLRNCAVVTLEEQANPRAADALLLLWTKEKDPEIRKDLLRAFGPVAKGRPEVEAILLPELDSGKENHRAASAMSLGFFLAGNDVVAKALETRFIKEKSSMVQIAILWGIGLSADPGQAGLLDRLMEKEKNESLRDFAEAMRRRLDGGGDPAAGGGGGGGGGGGPGGGGNGGGRGGWQTMRMLGPVFSEDKITRNRILDMQDRGRGGGNGGGGGNGTGGGKGGSGGGQ